MNIKDLYAYEILDSRGNPTVECVLILNNGAKGIASVPSGASKGTREALELRDNNENRYHGLGVLKAVENINEKIKPALLGRECIQNQIDDLLIKLDGTDNKSNLGANAILAVSLAALKAQANAKGKDLFEFVSTGRVSMPIPMMNIINGGVHAENSLDIQEFMIVPAVSSFKERLRAGSEVFHTLKRLLKENNYATSVGDEGGFAPNLRRNEDAIKFIIEAIKQSGYEPGKDIFIALDCAATEMYDQEKEKYIVDKKELSTSELIDYYVNLVNRYPIISIEDPFKEDDFEAFSELTKKLENKIMLVGDDYFVTNTKYLKQGYENHAGNAILLKANQVGTITEMIDTIVYAKKHHYRLIISHRSGETEDTFISDLAVGLSIPYIKTGSLSRGERIAKYNRLLRIENRLK